MYVHMTPHHVHAWHTQGYAVVRNLLDPCTYAAAHAYMHRHFTPHNPCIDFGTQDNSHEFPTGTPLDALSLDPSLMRACRTLLHTPHVLLSQSSAWSKGNQGKNNDQRMHQDANHSFLHPASWDKPEAVAAIIYFDDTDDTGGRTAVVPYDAGLYQPPYTAMPGVAGLPFHNDRQAAETSLNVAAPEVAYFRQRLYDAEIPVSVKPGDVLLYRLDVWHRGTPVRAGAVRRVLNVIYKRADAHHIYTWNAGYARRNYTGMTERLFCTLTPDQRTALGIPPVGHPYWTPTSLAHTAARYGHAFDTAPYRSRL